MRNATLEQKEIRTLEIVLGVLIVTIIVLIVMLAIPKTNVSNGEMTASYTYRDVNDNLFSPVGEDYYKPLNIVPNKQELVETIEKYSYKGEYYQEYKDDDDNDDSHVEVDDYQRPQDKFYDKFNDDDFEASNYLVLGYINEWCNVADALTYNGLNNNGSDVVVNLTIEIGCGPCAIERNLLFIEIPKNITKLNQVSYNVSKTNHDCGNFDVYKPIVYLYPETEMSLEVTLGNPERLTTTYPNYKNGWNIIARPDGTLTDLTTGRELYALYWEGIRNYEPDLSSGFIVKNEDSATFLEEKLEYLGLNSREAEEFIVYWLPKLESSPYNLIKFESLDVINQDMPLVISEDGKEITPDTLIRILMVYKPIEQPIEISEQLLPPTPNRHGFTVVEWGGTEL